jgi:hypothetical protein
MIKGCTVGTPSVVYDTQRIGKVYMPPFREKQHKKFVKKTLSIPSWINSQAEYAGINFSQTLQEALIEKLHLQ